MMHLIHLFALLDHFDNAKTEDYGINLKPSPYYEYSDFIQTLTQFHSGISILSLNIQSISAKFNELCIFIDTISEKAMIKIICLQETWLSENTNTAPYQLENYNLRKIVLWTWRVDHIYTQLLKI